MVDYDLKDDSQKNYQDDDKKCYPKRGSNQTPYQKIEFEIRKDSEFWPPITASNDQSNPIVQNSNPKGDTENQNQSTVNETKADIRANGDNFEMSIQKQQKNKIGEKLFDQFTKI